MKSISRSTRRKARNVAVPLVGTIAAVAAEARRDSRQVPITIMLGVAWGISSRNRAVDSELAYRTYSELKSVSSRLDKALTGTVGFLVDSNDGAKGIRSDLQSMQVSFKRSAQDVRDVAGSVVRTLNLTREIARKLEIDIVGSFPKGIEPPVTKVSDNSSARKSREDIKEVQGRRLHREEVEGRADTSALPVCQPTHDRVSHPEVKVAIIADEFTIESFRFEWTLKPLTKDNWEQELAEFNPDLLFVESAWEGNGGEWRYQLVGNSAPRAEIIALVKHCRQEGIPTAFWNKEDPPHFEDFLPTARLFDYIFTTEESLIEEYKDRTGNSEVALLPFAAQPAIHNPVAIQGVVRDRPVVFGGMYFREKYPERRSQMDRLLNAAKKVGLDIFSRNDGQDARYRYPDELAQNVRGSLTYPQMLSAYHAYKVVINVNSVVGSQSMCARRIFEATACGAAVVTEPTPAIERYFPGGLLSQVSDQDAAYHMIRSLVRSDEYRERKVLAAQRAIWRNHTYLHRARTVMETVGINFDAVEPCVSFFISTNRPSNLRAIFENVGRQSWSNRELLIATHGFEAEERVMAQLKKEFSISDLKVIPVSADKSLGYCLNRLVEVSTGDYLLRMDDDDFYGRWYAEDMVNALDFTKADLVGKSASYIYFEELDATALTFPGKENRFTDFVRGATFGGPRETFVEFPFPESNRSEDSSVLQRLNQAGKRIYSTNRFNYAVIRQTDKSAHTWQVEDMSLFGTGEMKFLGFDTKQIEA